MSKSTFLRQAIYNAILKNTSFQGVAQPYISLHSADPGLTGANEIAGNGYARVAINFAAPVGGVGSSSGTATFPAPTGAWANVTHFGIWDAAAGGNFYGGNAVTAPIAISVGVPVTFPTGNVSWTET